MSFQISYPSQRIINSIEKRKFVINHKSYIKNFEIYYSCDLCILIDIVILITDY